MVRGFLRFGNGCEWQNQIQPGFGDSLIITSNQFRTLLIEQLQFLELDQAERRANIIEAEIESKFQHIILTRPAFIAVPTRNRHSMRPEQTEAFGQFRIVCRDHPAFSGRHILVTEETEAACFTETSASSTCEQCAGRVGCILDKEYSV